MAITSDRPNVQSQPGTTGADIGFQIRYIFIGLLVVTMLFSAEIAIVHLSLMIHYAELYIGKDTFVSTIFSFTGGAFVSLAAWSIMVKLYESHCGSVAMATKLRVLRSRGRLLLTVSFTIAVTLFFVGFYTNQVNRPCLKPFQKTVFDTCTYSSHSVQPTLLST